MTTALFTFLVIGHILDSKQTESQSTWCMWKWATFLHQMAWEWNFIISLIFWTMIYPFETHVWSYPVNHWLEFMEHICPFALTTIDWFLNPMKYEK